MATAEVHGWLDLSEGSFWLVHVFWENATTIQCHIPLLSYPNPKYFFGSKKLLEGKIFLLVMFPSWRWRQITKAKKNWAYLLIISSCTPDVHENCVKVNLKMGPMSTMSLMCLVNIIACISQIQKFVMRNVWWMQLTSTNLRIVPKSLTIYLIIEWSSRKVDQG